MGVQATMGAMRCKPHKRLWELWEQWVSYPEIGLLFIRLIL